MPKAAMSSPETLLTDIRALRHDCSLAIAELNRFIALVRTRLENLASPAAPDRLGAGCGFAPAQRMGSASEGQKPSIEDHRLFEKES